MDGGVAPNLVGCVYTSDLMQTFQQLYGFAPSTRTQSNAAVTDTILEQSPLPGASLRRVKRLSLVLSTGPAATNGSESAHGGNNGLNTVLGIIGIAQAILKAKQREPAQSLDNPPQNNDGATNTNSGQPPPDVSTPATGDKTPVATNSVPADPTAPDPRQTPGSAPAGTQTTVDTSGTNPPSVSTTPAPPDPQKPDGKTILVPKPVKPVVHPSPQHPAEPADRSSGPYLPYVLGLLAIVAIGVTVWLRKPPALPQNARAPPPAAIARVTFDPAPASLDLHEPLLAGPQIRISVAFESTQPILSEAP